MSIIAAATAGAAARVRVQVGAGGVPSVPQNLSATAASASQINLTWDASTGSPTHYNIWRDQEASPSLVPTIQLIATSATNSYSDTGLQGLTRYTYFVTAVNAHGSSDASDPDTADTSTPANTIYVSPAGGGNGLSQDAPTTLATANSSVVKGGMVAMLGGNYGTAINPAAAATSASEADRITYKNVPGQQPVITSGSNAVTLVGKKYVTVDGVDGDGGSRTTTPFNLLVRIEDSHQIVIINCSMTWSTGRIVAVRGVGGSSSIYIINNYLAGAGDISVASNSPDVLKLVSASFTLVEGNTMRYGAHGLVSTNNFTTPPEAGYVQTNIVFRNNDLANDWTDLITTSNHSNRGIEIVNAYYCVFEDNLLYDNPWGPNSEPFHEGKNKFQGYRLIVRNNYTWRQQLAAFFQAVQAGPSPISAECRLYNNSVWGANLAGDTTEAMWTLFTGDGGPNCQENVFKNNAVRDSDTSQPTIILALGTSGVDANGTEVIANAFWPSEGQLRINSTTRTMSGWVSNPPTNGEVRDNINANPNWTGGAAPTTKAGFAPGAGSALIDAGDWLTTTVGTGSNSTTMVVADARYFFDGYGLAGVQGDLIQLEGQTATARITAVNYDTNTLTLATPLTWTSGLGVSLPYSGSAPDIGAVQT